MNIERHPLQPFLPEKARVLFLGSFPPPRNRWCMDFFYPNFINDHWRIEGLVFFGNKNHFVDTGHKTFRLSEIVDFLKRKGIGFFDTATAVRRLKENASDNFLEIVEPTDITALLRQIPRCGTLVTTGQKATEVISETFGCGIPPIGGSLELTVAGRPVRFWRMPSSSRAYPLPLPQKADLYRRLFTDE